MQGLLKFIISDLEQVANKKKLFSTKTENSKTHPIQEIAIL